MKVTHLLAPVDYCYIYGDVQHKKSVDLRNSTIVDDIKSNKDGIIVSKCMYCSFY
jgi:hypothetical protein